MILAPRLAQRSNSSNASFLKPIINHIHWKNEQNECENCELWTLGRNTRQTKSEIPKKMHRTTWLKTIRILFNHFKHVIIRNIETRFVFLYISILKINTRRRPKRRKVNQSVIFEFFQRTYIQEEKITEKLDSCYFVITLIKGKQVVFSPEDKRSSERETTQFHCFV